MSDQSDSGGPNFGHTMIENRSFSEIRVGDTVSSKIVLGRDHLALIAATTADLGVTTAHVAGFVTSSACGPALAATWTGLLITSLIATRLPGAGTQLTSQTLQFAAPVEVGDMITTTVTVRAMDSATRGVVLDCVCRDRSGRDVTTGTVCVRASAERLSDVGGELSGVRLSRHQRFRDLLLRAASGTALPLAVAYPCDDLSLGAVVEMAEAGLVLPVLVGPAARIRAVATAGGLDIADFPIIDEPDDEAAAARAVSMARAGEAALLMKGSLHTDMLMHAVLARETGLRGERRLSHVYLMDVPSYPRPLLLTDAALNIAPTLEDKRHIIQNAIDLAHLMGIGEPRVAVLSAVETVNPAILSTLDAAALCKMADRGQISGGLVDGPLAFDNAVSPEAARQKGIVSRVAGQADILVVPSLEAGNMLAKQLSFLAGADAAGVVVGARVPIILTSRADSERTRIASCAVAVLMARAAQMHAGADGQVPSAALRTLAHEPANSGAGPLPEVSS